MDGRIGSKALNFKNNECPGSYKLASIISEGTLNPGELVTIKQYITGYGQISGIKIVSYISNEIFDEELSYVENGFRQSEDNPNLLHWGGTKVDFTNSGLTLIPGSLHTKNWDSFIFDMNDGQTSILTERGLPEAPFTYKLKIKDKATSGQHYIFFYMTYFNGAEWICLEEKTPVKVNNKFEQNSTSLSIIAAIAIIVAIAHDGLFPVIDTLHEIAKHIQNIRSR